MTLSVLRLARNLGLAACLASHAQAACKTCPEAVIAPDFPIGGFPPPGVYAFHTSSTGSAAYCKWYSFPVEPGHRYDFRTCTPGRAGFDTILEVFTDACGPPPCGTPWRNDDAFGCGTASAVEIVCPLATTTLYLRVGGFGTSSGSYTLAYREVTCPSCTNIPVEISPTGTCQYYTDSFVNGGTNPGCFESWFRVYLTAGQGYVLTTCPDIGGFECPLADATPSTFDTEMFLFPPGTCPPQSPVASSTGSMSCPSIPTSRAAITYVAATTGGYPLRLRASAGNGRFGCYTLGYVQTTVPSCGNCVNGPFIATLTPTAACQLQSGIVTSCQDTWYLVVNRDAQALEFSTCSRPPPDCAGGSQTFDTAIEFWSSSCTLLQQDGDGCGGTQDLLVTPVLAPGIYKLRIRGGGVGSFNLTYRGIGGPCVPPSGLAVGPDSGVAGVASCTRSETFVVRCDATPSVGYAWNIVPPPGGMAVPSSGAMIGGPWRDNPASFTSTLLGEGVYSLTVAASNACSLVPPPSITVAYTLRDQSPPMLTVPRSTRVTCTRVPPPPARVSADNCDPAPVEDYLQTRIDGPCAGTYDLVRTWSATDRSGNASGPATQILTVQDRSGPLVAPGGEGYLHCLYPPNHVMHCFDASEFAPYILDDCSDPVAWRFVDVVNSEEPLGPCMPGDLDPDWTISPDGQTLCLRAERCGDDPSQDDGRRYDLFIVATDACGNAGARSPIGHVLVPHDDADTSDCVVP